MEKTEIPMYVKIDEDLNNRINVYLTEAGIARIEHLSNKRMFVEAALHEFMVNNPIHAIKHETRENDEIVGGTQNE